MLSDADPGGQPAPAGPRRLHPLSVLRGGHLREIATGVVAGLVGLGPVLGPLGVAGLLAVVVLVALGWEVLEWQRHTYELAGDTVLERRGVLRRRERQLAVARIQQVEVNRTLLDRLFGTAELRLETAGDAGESELTLRVVTEQEAERLRRRLRPPADGTPTPAAPAAPDAPGEPLVRVPLGHVALAAVTGTRLLIVPVLLAALFGLLQDLRLVERVVGLLGAWATTLSLLAAVVITLAVVTVALVVAAVTGVLRDGDFTLEERDGDLHLRRGLLATRETVIPRRRLQRVAVHRSWLRRALGFGALTLYSAGGRGQQDAGSRRRVTIPLLPDSRLEPVAAELLGTGPLPTLSGHPPMARRRAVVRWLLRLVLPVAAVTVLIGLLSPSTAVAVPLLLAVAVPLGFLEHAHLASGADERVAVGRHGALNVTTAVAPRTKVQGTTVARSLFQRRLGLATVRVHLAGPGGGVPLGDLGRDRAAQLGRELLRPPAAAAAPRG